MAQPKTAYVAMSGGVDSSVAALLLKKQGFAVVGVFMKPWSPSTTLRSSPLRSTSAASAGQAACMWREDRADAVRVAARLDIPLETWDFSRQYGAKVARPMVAGYRHGLTPNPDVECNRHIKFGLFAAKAFKAGADVIATGHYADVKGGCLVRPKDNNKDQTYFLWGVPSAVLARTLFPLAKLTKPEVRALAKKAGLATAAKKDSQGVCFVGALDMKSFLARRIRPRPGRILHLDGRLLGQHDGAAYYTIGQRHGLDIKDGGGPYFVVRRDVKRNIITVGPETALYATTARIVAPNWFGPRPKPGSRVLVQIRYRTPAVPAVLGSGGRIIFAKPVRAITPGQSAVVYRGSRLLGGGILV
jgi:tRNA-specific 2-thiouridylase